MQPLDNKRTKIQAGVSRARLLLKRDLAWLPGYPLKRFETDGGVGTTLFWKSESPLRVNTLPAGAIDGERLRRAQLTISKLRHRFPRALPKIVDDPDDWLRRIDFLLGLVKADVHRGQPFSSEDVLRSGVLPERWTLKINRMKSAHPPLAEMLDAVTFLALSNRQSCELESLQWIEKHAAELVLLGGMDPDHPCDLAIRMFSVREVLSSSLLKTLTRCFTDPLISACRWQRPDGRLRELRHATIKAAKQIEFVLPEDSGGETLAQLVREVFDEICLSESNVRRHRFQLFEAILNAGLIDNGAKIQRQIAASEETMCKLLRRFEARRGSATQTGISYHELKKKIATAAEIDNVQVANVTALGNCLAKLTRLGAQETRMWTDFSSGFSPANASLCVCLLDKWWRNRHSIENRQHDFIRVIRPLSALIRRRGVARPLQKHWSQYVGERHAYSEFVVDTCDELAGHPNLEVRSVRLLERIAYDLQIDLGKELLSSIAEFSQAIDDEKTSCSLIESLAKKPDAMYNATDLRLACHFGDSIDAISELAFVLQSDHKLTELATQLKPLADDRDLKQIVAKRLVENDLSNLSRIAPAIAILSENQHPLPKRERFEQSSEWMGRYPKDLHTALKLLGQTAIDAPKIAEGILGTAYPSPEKLLQEISAIESKLVVGVSRNCDEIQMQVRLANLRRRLTQSTPVSPARRDKLIAKLRKRAELEILQQYASTCQVQAAAAMQQRYDLKSFADEWWQPPLDRVLREIHRLSTPMRELGIRLIFETLEPATHNFDQEPRNVVFRERLEAAGVLMAPWLSDQLRHVATAADGTAYELAFTRDVIDFLLMGFHFDTCLSPDSFNFFSTVANAVDLNKRVVYAKTEAGKIIGRCLFALNDSGEILTYHRYSHDPRDGFSNAVDQFAQQLARQMQTSIATSGKVSKLVAKQWYDDGPWQTDSDWLSDDGTLTKLTQELAYEDLLPGLLQVKGREFLKHRVAELAIDTRVRNQPKLLLPLLDEFEAELSVKQKLTVAVNVESTEVSHRLLAQLRWSDIVGILNRHQCSRCDVFHGIAGYVKVFAVLTGYHPSLALRAIRASRPSSIRSDVEDANRTRRNALAQVHRTLGREQLADKLSGA